MAADVSAPDRDRTCRSCLAKCRSCEEGHPTEKTSANPRETTLKKSPVARGRILTANFGPKRTLPQQTCSTSLNAAKIIAIQGVDAAAPMARFDGFRPDLLPEFPENGTSGEGWLDWVNELLDNIFGGIPTFNDIREFLEENNWEDLVPDASDVSDLISTIYDKIEEEIDPSQYIPNEVLNKLDNIDVAEGIAELMAFGYDNLDIKGNYIDPWTDKVLDYTNFNVIVPRSGKVKTKGSNKDDLMSGHWESHKYEGGNGNDRIFTWYGEDTLVGGNGKDHLYADGDDCTMIGGNGKDYFYLDGDSTALIKDYEKKDVIRVDGYGKGNIKINHKKGNSLIKAGKHTLAKVVDTKLSKGDLQYSGGNSKNRSIDDVQYSEAYYRTPETTESDEITFICTSVFDI